MVQKTIEDLLGQEAPAGQAASAASPTIEDYLGVPANGAAQATAQAAQPNVPSGPDWERGPGGIPVDKNNYYDNLVAGGILRGMSGVMGLPGDLEALGNKYLPDWIPSIGLARKQGFQNNRIFPTSEELQAGVAAGGKAMGIPVGEALATQPQTAAQRYLISAPAQAAGGALMPGGGGLLANLGATEGGEAMGQIMPDSGVARALGGAAGAMLTHRIGTGLEASAGRSAAMDTLNKAQDLQTQSHEALADAQDIHAMATAGHNTAQEAELAAKPGAQAQAAELAKVGPGITAEAKANADQIAAAKADALAKAKSTSLATQQAAQQEFDTATAESEAKRANVESAAKNVIESRAQVLGPAQSYEEAGRDAQAQANDWVQNKLPEARAQAYAPLDAAVPADSPVQPSAYGATLKRLVGGNEPGDQLAAPLVPSGTKALYSAYLKAFPQDKGEASLEDLLTGAEPAAAGGAGPSITYQQMKNLRTFLGDARGNFALKNSVGTDNLNKLYAAATSDMRDGAVNAAGPEGGQLFDQVNQQVEHLYDIKEKGMSNLIKSPGDTTDEISPAKAAQNLTSKGAHPDEIGLLREAIPGAVDNIAAAHIRESGGNLDKLTPGQTNALIGNPEHVNALTQAQSAIQDAKTVHEQNLQDAATLQLNKVKGAKTDLQNNVGAANESARMASGAVADNATEQRAQLAARVAQAKAEWQAIQQKTQEAGLAKNQANATQQKAQAVKATAKNLVDTARANPAVAAPAKLASHIGSGLFGAALGEGLEPMLGHLSDAVQSGAANIGISPGMEHALGAYGMIAGLGAPVVYNALKSGLRNPMGIRVPVQGAEQGQATR